MRYKLKFHYFLWTSNVLVRTEVCEFPLHGRTSIQIAKSSSDTELSGGIVFNRVQIPSSVREPFSLECIENNGCFRNVELLPVFHFQQLQFETSKENMSPYLASLRFRRICHLNVWWSFGHSGSNNYAFPISSWTVTFMSKLTETINNIRNCWLWNTQRTNNLTLILFWPR